MFSTPATLLYSIEHNAVWSALVVVATHGGSHVVADPPVTAAVRAADVALLGFGAVIDNWQGFLNAGGFTLLGLAAWRGRYWPRWLAALAISNGVLELLSDVDLMPLIPSFVAYYALSVLTAAWTMGLCLILWQSGGTLSRVPPRA